MDNRRAGKALALLALIGGENQTARSKRGRCGDDGARRVRRVGHVADGASELAAEEVHEVKAEARSSRDFSRELGDFFDGLGPAAYAQEAPPPDSESDDETKTPS